MTRWPVVPVNKLYKTCKPSYFTFKTTEEVPPIDTIIGQGRAQRAVEFGLRVKKQGYNIFLAGLTGTGKLTHALAVVQDLAKIQPLPRDWCYVTNFDHPSQPQAISLPAGMGKEFAKDVRELVNDLKTEIAKSFESEDLERQKQDVFQKLEADSDDLFDELNLIAKEKDFVLKRTTSGFVILPIVNGETVSEENFATLAEEIQDEIEERSAEIQVKAAAIACSIKKR